MPTTGGEGLAWANDADGSTVRMATAAARKHFVIGNLRAEFSAEREAP
jgi:hypothetical protein